jgi:general secretion pathway protein K
MKISPHPSARGFAVLVALVAVAVLSILAGALALSMKVETQLAQYSNDSEKMLWVARGGAEYASWVLANEPPGPSSLQNIWAGGPGVGPETNGPLTGLRMNDPVQVGDGTVSVTMTEQESKININSADADLLHSVLADKVDAGDISPITDAILDWIDTDDSPHLAGAESDYYQGLNPPYYAKNAPMDSLDEIQLTKGFIEFDQRMQGKADTASPFPHHQLGFSNQDLSPEELLGFFHTVFTPYSNGKVNINTAKREVLELIPFMDAPTLDAIDNLRQSAGGPIQDGIIANLGQLQSVVSNPQIIQQLNRYCTTRGDTYEVEITAAVGSSQRKYVAVIYRNGNRTQIVGFHAK